MDPCLFARAGEVHVLKKQHCAALQTSLHTFLEHVNDGSVFAFHTKHYRNGHSPTDSEAFVAASAKLNTDQARCLDLEPRKIP